MIKKILKDFLFHFCIFAAPAYVALSYRIVEIMEFNKSTLEIVGIKDWALRHNTIIVIFIAFIIPLIFTLIKRFIEEKTVNKIESFHQQMYDVSGKIFVVLNEALSVKRRTVLKCLNTKENNPDETFTLSDVVKPTEQILKIFEGIMFIFTKITNNDHLKISVIECKNQKLFKYLYMTDDNPSTEIKELNEKRSTARQCIVKKKLILYETTNSLIRRNWFCGDKTRIKSIICYPVISGKNILYVISLSSNVKNTFRESDRIKYELIFEQLSHRIMLESYLSKIIQN